MAISNRFIPRLGAALVALVLAAGCAGTDRGLSGAALPQEHDASTAAVAQDDASGVAAPVPPADAPTAASEAANPFGALAAAGDIAVGDPGSGGDAGADVAASPLEGTPDVAGAPETGAVPAASGAAAAVSGAPLTRSLLPSSSGNPASCKAMLKAVADKAKASGGATIAVTLVPINGAYVGYVQGMARFAESASLAGTVSQGMLQARLWQQFSDRVVPGSLLTYKGASGGGAPSMPSSEQRFSQGRLDIVGVTLDLDTGALTLVLESWGSTVVRLNPTCSDGVLWGYGGGNLFVVTIKS